MSVFHLGFQNPFDIRTHFNYLTSHNQSVITRNDLLTDIKYLANSSALPSPGFRILARVYPGLTYVLTVDAVLREGDRAFVYCEDKKVIDGLDSRIIPRTYFFTQNGISEFEIKFVPNANFIFIGILFYGPEVTYHLQVRNFVISQLDPNPTGLAIISKRPIEENKVVNFDKVIEVLKDYGRVILKKGRVIAGVNDKKYGFGKGLIYNNNMVNTAVIVEPRLDPFLMVIVDHFMEVLPRNWNIQIFHGDHNADMLKDYYGDQKVDSRLKLLHLPIFNLSREQYSRLLLYSEFYEAIETESILVFQTDTCLNPNNARNLDQYMDYDYVGSPWKSKIVSLVDSRKVNKVGNGGLSLRKKSSMIKICNLIMEPKYRFLLNYHEDQVISSVLNHGLIKNSKMPTMEVAKKFGVESVFYPDPVGIHQAWRWLSVEDFARLRVNMPVIDKLFKGRVYK